MLLTRVVLMVPELPAFVHASVTALWFAEQGGNKIGRITTNGTITEYSANLDSNADPTGIAAGPDGNMWFAETGTDKMGRVKL